MSLRNENIAVVVSVVVMTIGCWLADWDVSDGEGAAIMGAAFVAGYATLVIPFERQRHQRSRQD